MLKPLRLPIFGLLLFIFSSMQAQETVVPPSKAYQESVTSLDQILENLYAVISGEKGEARDWDHFRYLFHPEAKLIPSGQRKDGSIGVQFWTVEDYISKAGDYLVQQGFYELEIHRETDSFGNMTQVFSTYESYHSAGDAQPFSRGINSIQLMFDGERWWILNIYWTAESDANPIPERYLPQ